MGAAENTGTSRPTDAIVDVLIIGSGADALLCRYKTGRRKLDAEDQLTLEFAGVYRHYHSCLMRTIPIGKVPPQQVEMHKVAVDALEACKAALKPGRPIGEVFDAHARVLDAAGYRQHRMNATGYSLGATFAPGAPSSSQRAARLKSANRVSLPSAPRNTNT